MEQQDNDRTESARRHDDHELIDAAESGALEGGRSGGWRQTEVGTRDELVRELDPSAPVTGLQKGDEQGTFKPGRADNEGANG